MFGKFETIFKRCLETALDKGVVAPEERLMDAR